MSDPISELPGAHAARSGADYLKIYLADHHAGSSAGIELARRCAASNTGNDLGVFLEVTLIPEILEDRESLEEVMAWVGAPAAAWKDALAWAGEKIGRVKLNGQLRGYSPLSRMVEVEGLLLGVRAKLCGWSALKEVQGSDARLAGFDFDALAARATAQVDALEEFHRRAARATFLAGSA